MAMTHRKAPLKAKRGRIYYQITLHHALEIEFKNFLNMRRVGTELQFLELKPLKKTAEGNSSTTNG